MTHVELIEAIRDDYIKQFELDPTDKEDVKNFRQGVIFAYDYLLVVLKNGDEWIYKKDCEFTEEEGEDLDEAQREWNLEAEDMLD